MWMYLTYNIGSGNVKCVICVQLADKQHILKNYQQSYIICLHLVIYCRHINKIASSYARILRYLFSPTLVHVY